MNQALQKFVDGIDAMALRQRAMFFGAVALVLMTLLQVFLLNPLLARRNQLSQQIAQQQDEVKAIQGKIQSLVKPDQPDPDERNRERLAGLRAQMAQYDRQFEQQQKQLVTPASMAAMLQNMIRRNPNLELMSLRNLPGGSAAEGVDAQAGKTGKGGGREIYRHTVELNVRGSYFDLLDYVAALERMPQHLFWVGLELDAAGYPQSVLKLTVYTLSPDKSWLTVG